MKKNDRDVITSIFVNLGKSIAAYEETINLGISRFDQYVESLQERDK